MTLTFPQDICVKVIVTNLVGIQIHLTNFFFWPINYYPMHTVNIRKLIKPVWILKMNLDNLSEKSYTLFVSCLFAVVTLNVLLRKSDLCNVKILQGIDVIVILVNNIEFNDVLCMFLNLEKYFHGQTLSFLPYKTHKHFFQWKLS